MRIRSLRRAVEHPTDCSADQATDGRSNNPHHLGRHIIEKPHERDDGGDGKQDRQSGVKPVHELHGAIIAQQRGASQSPVSDAVKLDTKNLSCVATGFLLRPAER